MRAVGGPLRVVLIAEEAAGGRALKLLCDTPGVSLEAVLASPGRRGGMGSVWSLAERAGLPIIPAERVRDPALAREFADRRIDLLLNVHSLHLVHPALLEVPRLGAFNLHPGPLPEMAGLNVPSWAILLDHREHGVTLHRMQAGIDDGAIAYESRFPVPYGASGLTLSLECVRRGIPLLGRLLEAARRGEPIPARKQDLSLRRYFDGRPPEGGSLDFDRPAGQVEAHVRAADYRPFRSPWGHPQLMAESGTVGLIDVAVLKLGGRFALPLEPPGTVRWDGEHGARVACADGWVRVESVLVDEEVRPARAVLRDGEELHPLGPRAVLI